MRPVLQCLRERLEQVSAANRGLRLCGAATCLYQLNPALEKRQVALLERRYGISLPEGYRAFLCEGGNGGAGSDYGLVLMTVGPPPARKDLQRSNSDGRKP
jgi:hypothetical protein